MKKIIPILIICLAFVITGCKQQTKPVDTIQQEETQKESVFNNTHFSFTLPAPHIAESGLVKAKDGQSFNQIVYQITPRAKKDQAQLLQWEKDNIQMLCKDTDACGEIISSENVTLNKLDGIKFTIQYKGRAIDDPEGFVNEFHYSFSDDENHLRFWSSAADTEDTETIEKQFDTIMSSIKFK